ncbi:aminodeoxychorismate lyase [Steroidobacter sp.]|uniref:aminodeoxychorismate lyase n=1 Tax=Steroidobacter sp. TaxID=1978227 RepID=UPI001A4D74D0|nr:aminodeoxychorismate lyase [Steroidobacter sp.]MBL8266749.1 aminodeoxychorismate lyase [Steroidobacter sp.]
MTLAMLINGQASNQIPADDRGFQYGDGLFETALLAKGQVRFLDDHLRRLATGCSRLGIAAPDERTLRDEIAQVTKGSERGVLKIIVTRGSGGRGYRPGSAASNTRVVALHPLNHVSQGALRLRWCEIRLGRNARLAGIKHLNRLEHVLAQSEWSDGEADEGLMLDTEGELVCATAGNVFAVRDGALITPDLRFCGVQGVMRAQVLKAAARLGLPVTEEPLWPDDLQAASEIFITNAVRGIRSVAALDSLQWSETGVAERLAAALSLSDT